MIIVNADDFGRSRATNQAVIACFKMRAISSATIMANMPFFDEACAAATDLCLGRDIGIHINITEGTPLTDRIRNVSMFCNCSGQFQYRRLMSRFLNSEERKALSEEVVEQISRCRQNGLTLSHADSHHHVHTDPAIFLVVASILRAVGIRCIRISRNAGYIPPALKLAKAGYNSFVRLSGFNTTRFFGGLSDFEYKTSTGGPLKGSFEIMVHPVINSDGEIVDMHEKRSLIHPLLQATERFKLVSFASWAR
jgi:hypothetical protein